MKTTCASSSPRSNRPATAAILTTGCRLNQSESDALRQQLLLQGVRIVADPADADVCYVNTCTVTAAADRSSMQLLHRARRAATRVIALGCLAERDPERLRAAGADETWTNRHKQQQLAGITPLPVRSRALLKVQDGCRRRCSYCAVSGLRGEPRSLPVADALRQFDELASQGFNEVVLTGLNLGTYDDAGTTLAGLVVRMLERPGAARIRIGSIEPDTVGDDLIRLLSHPRLCPHLHLPLQSGDDAVLDAMRRPYTRADYERLVARIRHVCPDSCIGADVIAGFPGEDDDAFNRTLALIERAQLSYLHAFTFSARPGTDAARGATIPVTVARDRVRRLRAVSENHRQAFERRFVGTVRRAIIETPRSALTDNYLRLDVNGGGLARGSLVPLQVERAGDRLSGHPC